MDKHSRTSKARPLHALAATKAQRWLLLLVSCIAVATAVRAGARSRQDGRAVFVQKCGSCHGAGQRAPSVNPAQFAALQWRNWFRREKHKRIEDFGRLITLDDEKAILEYLTRGAADSDYPERAAIP